MTDNNCLYLRHGTYDGQDWKQVCTKLGIKTGEANYSWYEPNPESLIDAKRKAPIVCFFKGEPKIPDGVTWSRLMLFYSDGALTLVPDGNRLRYACWQTKYFPGAIEITPVVCNIDRALLKTQERLRNQFSVTKEIDLFPAKDGDVTSISPQIIEYYHQGSCIAWTLKEGN